MAQLLFINVYRWMDGWMDGWIDSQVKKKVHPL